MISVQNEFNPAFQYNIDKSVENSLFDVFDKMLNKESSEIIEFINESKGLLSKIKYIGIECDIPLCEEGFLFTVSRLDNYFINPELLEWVRDLIQRFPYLLNMKDGDGWTPLHIAVQKNNESLVSLFIDLKCDLEAKTNSGSTPLLLACCYGKITIIIQLIESGADINACDNDKHGILHCLIASDNLFDNELETQWLRYLIQRFPDLLDAQNINGSTPLHSAIRNNKQSLISAFIELKCDIKIPLNHGITPLLLASFFGNILAMNQLIEFGADAANCDHRKSGILHNLVTSKILFNNEKEIQWLKDLIYRFPFLLNQLDKDNWTPLHLAILKNKEPLISLFVELKCDLEIKTNEGYNALLLACYYGKTAIANVLIKSNADIATCNNNNSGILHHLVDSDNLFDNIEEIKWLKEVINNFPELLNHQDKYGWTPLHVAVKNSKESLISLFTELKCDLEAKTNDGYTPLLIACVEKKITTANLLIKSGADVTACSNEKYGVVHCVVEQQDSLVEDEQIQWLKDLLHRFPKLINQQDKDNWTPLHFAIKNNNEYLISLLVELHCNIEAKTNLGGTPLLLACACGKISIINLLMQLGADINALDNFGEGIIYKLIQSRNFLLNDEQKDEQIEWLKDLIHKFSDLKSQQNKNGCTVMQFAALMGKIQIVKLLKKDGFFMDNLSAFLVNELDEQIMDKSINPFKTMIYQTLIIKKIKDYMLCKDFKKSKKISFHIDLESGICQGLNYLFGCHFGKGRGEEFYQCFEEGILKWDGNRNSLSHQPLSPKITEKYSTINDLFQRLLKNVLLFQVKRKDIDDIFKNKFLLKNDFFKLSLRYIHVLTKKAENLQDLLVYQSTDIVDQMLLIKDCEIGSKNYLGDIINIREEQNSFFSIVLEYKDSDVQHCVGIHISQEKIVSIYDSNRPYRIASYQLSEKSPEIFLDIIETYLKIAYNDNPKILFYHYNFS